MHRIIASILRVNLQMSRAGLMPLIRFIVLLSLITMPGILVIHFENELREALRQIMNL